MILNYNGNGAEEMRRLTGSYYVNNNFDVIMLDVMQAEDTLREVISDAVFSDAETLYHDGASDNADIEFVTLVQRCVALLAAVNFFRKNDVSHEDSGRKVKVSSDDSEKIPWEWQLDRDDHIHLEAYYKSVEMLIRYLNKTERKSWTNSAQYQAARSLLIRSGKQFDAYFPISGSERLYILMIGFIREVQISVLQPAFGDGFDAVLKDSSLPESDTHFAACKACALLSMSIALRRLPLAVIPRGVIRGYAAENGSVASQPATIKDIRTVADWMEADGNKWLGLMKEYRDGPSSTSLNVIPDNDPKQKYFRT